MQEEQSWHKHQQLLWQRYLEQQRYKLWYQQHYSKQHLEQSLYQQHSHQLRSKSSLGMNGSSFEGRQIQSAIGRPTRKSFNSAEILCILGSACRPQILTKQSPSQIEFEYSQPKKQRSQSPSQALKKKSANGGDQTDNGNSSYSGSRSGGGSQGSSKVTLASNMEPTYYIGGGNGNAILEEVMNGFGWRRIKDKTDENFKLRWCESKSAINYNAFKEGEQLVNHIPNCNLLTNKMGLLNSLQEFSRVCANVQKKAMKLDFIPETYRLDDPKDKELFLETYKENEIWICKPTGRNQGKGIFLIRSIDELNRKTKETEEENQQQGKQQKPLIRIIQRYITNPLLIEGRKFDIRCYMLIASTVPYLLLYHKGYLRLSIYEYDNDCDNIIAHLTNQFIQKKDPRYIEEKEETAWSMDKFNEYLNEKVADDKGIEQNWVYNSLTNQMKQIMTHCFNAVKHRLHRKVGYFDLYGLDFMIDEDMKVWLIEMNINPCLATNCGALKEVVPGVVRETLNLVVECFEKARRNRPILPLNNLKEFEILFSDTSKPGGGQLSGSPQRSSSTTQGGRNQPPELSKSPVRGGNLSPVKEPNREQNKTKRQPEATVTKITVVDNEQQGPKKSTKVQKIEKNDQDQVENKEMENIKENEISEKNETKKEKNSNKSNGEDEKTPKENKKEKNLNKTTDEEQNPEQIKQKKVGRAASNADKTSSPVTTTKESKSSAQDTRTANKLTSNNAATSMSRLKLTQKKRQNKDGVEEKPNRGS